MADDTSLAERLYTGWVIDEHQPWCCVKTKWIRIFGRFFFGQAGSGFMSQKPTQTQPIQIVRKEFIRHSFQQEFPKCTVSTYKETSLPTSPGEMFARENMSGIFRGISIVCQCERCWASLAIKIGWVGKRKFCYIADIYVEKTRRNKGVGAALLDRLYYVCQTLKLSFIFGVVAPESHASYLALIRFNKKRTYTVITHNETRLIWKDI